MEIPLVVDGQEIISGEKEHGSDPGDNAKVWYSYQVANPEIIDRALAVAREGATSWNDTPADVRRSILFKAGAIMQEQRALAIARLFLKQIQKSAKRSTLPAITERMPSMATTQLALA
jgi:acyl-CoA reductase-like NAD-dependent aldehyde dehydrogenase